MELPPPQVLRALVKQHGSYRAVAVALDAGAAADRRALARTAKRVEYACRKAGIASPAAKRHMLTCVFCGISNLTFAVTRYHLIRSTHQLPRRAGSISLCDDCYARKVTPRRAYPSVVR